jgi:hypothetical protein
MLRLARARPFFLSSLVLWMATVFVGSSLLFAVQPMIARMLLPRAGGAPAVWTTSVLFFQAALFAGYAYAHWSSGLARRSQLALHAALLLLPLFLLPFPSIEGAPSPGAFTPALWLLGTLVTTIGLPFFVLAAGTPLLQSWLNRTSVATDPYVLYAASNAGSLIALCSYPVLIEPAFGLDRQRHLWAWGYGAYLILALLCAARAWSGRSAPKGPNSSHGSARSPLPLGRRILWVALAAAPSSAMLGVTSVLTTDIASMPFLWVLPLALYLLSFILAFYRPGLRRSGLWARILPIAAVVFTILWATKATEPLSIVVPAHLMVFFIAAMACHTELARLRPHPGDLTAYYLLIGLGGLLGGAFNSLLAPVLFEDWIETPLAFVASCLLVPRTEKSSTAPLLGRSDIAVPLALGAAALALVKLGDAYVASSQMREVLTAGIPALLVYLASERQLRFGLTLGTVLWAASHDTALRGEPRYTDRSFFGVHRVTRVAATEDGAPIAFHQLYHGTTIHGAQRVESGTGVPMDPREPLAYYSRTSPVGRLFASFRSPPGPRRVALVGLGAGSLLAYAEAGQTWTLFEIDPLVLRIAEDERYFTYLREARKRGVEIEVVLGDARLELSSTAGPFDLLVLDAFSSGAIPIHLLTREAFALYDERLAPDGTLALHISNRHLDLAPLVRAMASDLGFASVIEEDVATLPFSPAAQNLGSRWAFLTRSPAAHRSGGSGAARVWTDDHSDLWSLFQW